MNHHGLMKDQLLHLLFGAFIFLVLGSVAVALDLAASLVGQVGVSDFTRHAIEWAAHGMLALDLALFGVYLARTSWTLVKETLQ